MFRLGSEALALSRAQTLNSLHRIIPRDVVKRSIGHGQRRRGFCARLPEVFMVYFVLALGLFTSDCYRQVFRWLRPYRKGSVPGRSTLCEARKRLGVAPMVRLARQTVKLLATPQTAGAFYRQMRLMALDGFIVDLPDSPDNDRVFGKAPGGRAPGAFPQARVVALCEAGTHVIWRWLIKPRHVAEQTMANGLIRFLQPNMLLMWDCNFLSYARVYGVIRQKAHLLARVRKGLVFDVILKLSDGSYLARLYQNQTDRDHNRYGIVVRVLDYTLNDPNRGGHGKAHRLITTLLDAELDPAKVLIQLYHLRWEEELAIDELKTHQTQRPVLRSQTPAGVVQELYALLLDHFVVRVLMFEAAQVALVSPLSISFTGTLKILRCRIPQCPRERVALHRWWKHLVQEVSEERLPARRNRIEPRVIKRKMSKWPKKQPDQTPYPQPKRSFMQAIAMIH